MIMWSGRTSRSHGFIVAAVNHPEPAPKRRGPAWVSSTGSGRPTVASHRPPSGDPNSVQDRPSRMGPPASARRVHRIELAGGSPIQPVEFNAFSVAYRDFRAAADAFPEPRRDSRICAERSRAPIDSHSVDSSDPGFVPCSRSRRLDASRRPVWKGFDLRESSSTGDPITRRRRTRNVTRRSFRARGSPFYPEPSATTTFLQSAPRPERRPSIEGGED